MNAFRLNPPTAADLGSFRCRLNLTRPSHEAEVFARVGQSFDPCDDVDAVAVKVVVLHDDVAEIDADAQFDTVVRRDAGIPLRPRLLHRDRAAHGTDDARNFHQHAVAGGLDALQARQF